MTMIDKQVYLVDYQLKYQNGYTFYGLTDEVVIRLMSGKEADVFIVRCG